MQNAQRRAKVFKLEVIVQLVAVVAGLTTVFASVLLIVVVVASVGLQHSDRSREREENKRSSVDF